MTANFFGFSPDSFEQFVRSVGLSVFGPGLSIFGNGPDGGREATFRGAVPYPFPPTTEWSGYGVIQAKCKEKPESSRKDQAWALRQLEIELTSFVETQKRNPKPDFYIFVTNVELSSTSGGGKDKAERLIQSYYKKLPLKGHDVWDSNRLTTFLQRYEDLRTNFSAYLTPGDVLATILARVERQRPRAIRVLTGFLERELRADEAARLDQAGNRTDEQLRLARLFFDIPVSESPHLTPPDERPDEHGRLPHGVLYELLRSGSRRLDPTTVYEQERTQGDAEGEGFVTRYVLLGGPGSGKSTVGQFLAQIHRAALLERRPPQELLPETRQIVEETRELCTREGLPWPATPRYPFRIELNRFAKSMASKQSDRSVRSLNGYLMSELARDEPLDVDDLMELLAKHPWLLILDGLDEVPATSNRDAVVATVNDFLASARRLGSDLFIVATSRQQGYAGEFATNDVGFRHMLPLSTIRAIRYVERYAEARFGKSDPNRARDVISHVRKSADNTLTAQLMASPLQVTFMATVIAARGDPGQSRWSLFENYYRTIYERELQKAVPPYDEVLSRYQATIDRLHHDIGFWLQFTGETARGMSVTLPLSRFKGLVQAYLKELGHEGPEGELLVKRIVDAARHRLIFITSRTEDELSFDVRSLQEYMASECLMTGEADLVKPRLRAIAPIAYWRNVFLFAASKCFSDARSRHLQDTVRILCVDLSSASDTIHGLAKVGPELALDILQGGALGENLNYARQLAALALSLAERPALIQDSNEGASADRRMALAYRHGLDKVYEEKLKLIVGQADIYRSLGAWPVLIRLIARDVNWAASLAEEHWPIDAVKQWEIIRESLGGLDRVPWLSERLAAVIPILPPEEIGGILFSRGHSRSPDASSSHDLLDSLTRAMNRFGPTRTISLRIEDTAFSMNFTPLRVKDKEQRAAFQRIEAMRLGDSGWLPLIRTSRFLASPCCETLAEILLECANEGWPSKSRAGLDSVPWPLASCLHFARTTKELSDLAEAAKAGLLGDTHDWEQAEARWNTKGLDIQELIDYWPLGLPFRASVSTHGWPISPIRVYGDGDQFSESSIIKLISLVESSAIPDVRNGLMQTLSAIMMRDDSASEFLDPERFRGMLECSLEPNGPTFWWPDDLVRLPRKVAEGTAGRWIEFFDWLGTSRYLFDGYPVRFIHRGQSGEWNEVWENAFIVDNKRVGLLRLLAFQAASGAVLESIPESLLRVEAFDDFESKLSALLLLVTRSSRTIYDVRHLAEVASQVLNSPAAAKAESLLLRAVERHLNRVKDLGEFLLDLYGRTPRVHERRLAKIERLLRQVLRRCTSELQSPGQLLTLRLPEISPLASI